MPSVLTCSLLAWCCNAASFNDLWIIATYKCIRPSAARPDAFNLNPTQTLSRFAGNSGQFRHSDRATVTPSLFGMSLLRTSALNIVVSVWFGPTLGMQLLLAGHVPLHQAAQRVSYGQAATYGLIEPTTG
eukprot:5899035-Amphidinium_carterae.1